MNVIGHAVGISVLGHRAAYAENHKHIKHERQRVTMALSKLGFSVIPSHANFLLARVPAGQEGSWWQAALERQKILVAFFPDEGLENYIRISIGTKDQMDEFLGPPVDISWNGEYGNYPAVPAVSGRCFCLYAGNNSPAIKRADNLNLLAHCEPRTVAKIGENS